MTYTKNSNKYTKLIGKIFGKLKVISYSHTDPRNGLYWNCLCDCGNKKEVVVSTHNLNGKAVLSCGCLVTKNGQSKRANLIGEKFSFLTVIDSIHDKTKMEMIWICKCECGNITNARWTDLKSGKVKSCGCFRAQRLDYGENCFNRLFGGYKAKSKKMGIPFDLTKEQFRFMTKQNCFYCGIEPKQISKNKKAFGEYVYNGIDRINSSKGYTIDNCVPCCGMCNVAKNNYTKNEFIEWVQRIYINIFQNGEK